MPKSLYLMRHGQSQANAEQIVVGSHDSPLSPIGVKQAVYAGQTFKRFFKFDLIVTSPQDRAQQTAHIVAEQIGYHPESVLVIDDLRERNLGEVEGMSYAVAPHHNGNFEDAENVPGVEPIADLYARAQRVIDELRKRPEKNILIVGHNGCGRMLKVAARGGRPMDMYRQPRMENAAIYRLV